MLTPHFFSNLLTYQLFAPALLRFAAAAVLFYLAYWHFKNKKTAAQEISVLSHQMAVWAIGFYILIEAAVGLSLLIGYWTQLAALIGALMCIKVLILKRSLHTLAPLSRSTYALLIIICLSLVLTGAGIVFAVDLPL
jgi:uncharacterized membrane protein YphA (DoxX/SURF4 family)